MYITVPVLYFRWIVEDEYQTTIVLSYCTYVVIPRSHCMQVACDTVLYSVPYCTVWLGTPTARVAAVSHLLTGKHTGTVLHVLKFSRAAKQYFKIILYVQVPTTVATGYR